MSILNTEVIAMIRVKVNRPAFEIALRRHNLAQVDLSKKIGCSRGYISNILNNRSEPSPCMRRLILDQLPGYTFDDLFIIEQDEQKDGTN